MTKSVMKHSKEIVVAESNTAAKIVKRSAWIIGGAGLLAVSVFMQMGNANPESLFFSLKFAIPGLILTSYGAFYNRLRPKLFFEFSKERIRGRFSKETVGGIQLSPIRHLRRLIAKSHIDEFDYSLADILRLDIKETTIVIDAKNGETKTIPIGGLSYNLIKNLKSEFGKYNSDITREITAHEKSKLSASAD